MPANFPTSGARCGVISRRAPSWRISGKDSYSHIHYDSEQARTISVREAARLQSFPDGFVFCGTMNPAVPADRQRRAAAPGQGPRLNHTNGAERGVGNGHT